MSIKSLWKTRNGKEIPIYQMKTQHILNAVKMLERDKDMLKQSFIRREKYLGTADGDNAEQMSDIEWLIKYTPYEHLKNELSRRNQNE